MGTSPVFLVVSALPFLSGCAAWFAASRTPSALVPNPLSGKPVQVATSPTDYFLESISPDDCNRWPIRDTWSVSADSSEVCVTHDRMLSLAPGEIAPASPEKVTVATDKAGSVTVELTPNVEPPRHGFCHVASEVRTVWKLSYRGCASNDAVLTISSKRLLVSQAGRIAAAWQFESPNTGDRQPPTSTAQLTPANE